MATTAPSQSAPADVLVSDRPAEAQRIERDERCYERAVAAMRASGELDTQIRKGGCGRCGGDLMIIPQPYHAGGGVVAETTVNLCRVCRVDRVRRWTDLIQASAAEGRELRTVEFRPTARRLAAAGLVRYDNTDGAWDLTGEGLALLRRYDAIRSAAGASL